jgi:hypothetical protein
MEIKISHLKTFLFLVALHSFFVGIGLIAIPAKLFLEFGYNPITENFFRAQGGVFHLVMVVAYLFAMRDPIQNKMMVLFSITAKFIATIFLFTYFIFSEQIIVILLSGIGDLAMGLIILYLSKKLNLL